MGSTEGGLCGSGSGNGGRLGGELGREGGVEWNTKGKSVSWMSPPLGSHTHSKEPYIHSKEPKKHSKEAAGDPCGGSRDSRGESVNWMSSSSIRPAPLRHTSRATTRCHATPQPVRRQPVLRHTTCANLGEPSITESASSWHRAADCAGVLLSRRRFLAALPPWPPPFCLRSSSRAALCAGVSRARRRFAAALPPLPPEPPDPPVPPMRLCSGRLRESLVHTSGKKNR